MMSNSSCPKMASNARWKMNIKLTPYNFIFRKVKLKPLFSPCVFHPCHSSLISLTTHSRAPLILNYYVFNFSTKKNCSISMYFIAKQTRLHFVHSPCLWLGLSIPLFLNWHVLKLSHMKLSVRYFYNLTITFLYVYYV